MTQEIYHHTIKVRGKTFTLFKEPTGFYAQCNELPDRKSVV